MQDETRDVEQADEGEKIDELMDDALPDELEQKSIEEQGVERGDLDEIRP
ncbi:MAG: hypothetical protein ABR583_11080 [Gaiellaceae bacterium]